MLLLGQFLLFKLEDFLVILGSISNGQKVGAIFFFFFFWFSWVNIKIFCRRGQNIYFGVSFYFPC